MSKGPGRIMRSINAAIAAEPKRRFTYDELVPMIAEPEGGPSSDMQRYEG